MDGQDFLADEIAAPRIKRGVAMTNWVRVSKQGLFKVLVGGLSPRTVILTKAGIQNVTITTTSWIPAKAGIQE